MFSAILLVLSFSALFLYFRTSPLSGLSDYELSLSEFSHFSSKYSKSYPSDSEFFHRYQIFLDNSAYIRLSNQRLSDWTLGINEFADLTPQEFASKHLTYQGKEKTSTGPSFYHSGLGLPTIVDWQKSGAVTPIKNEGQCGACWAFSTTGAVEGIWEISGNPLVSLSEQQLIDCSSPYGNFGCNGGFMDNSFKYVVAKGLTSEANYPYTGASGKCNTAAEAKVVASISGYQDVVANSKNSLMGAVAQQPIAVAVDAIAWQTYASGVLTGNCGSQLNFAALIVGYNTVNVPNYWKVKNIWGTDWGQSGYILIGITSGEGLCGINKEPSYPLK